MVWADTIGSSYKNFIYDIGTYYVDNVSPSSMSGASIGGSTANDEVHEMIFKLNAELLA